MVHSTIGSDNGNVHIIIITDMMFFSDCFFSFEKTNIATPAMHSCRELREAILTLLLENALLLQF